MAYDRAEQAVVVEAKRVRKVHGVDSKDGTPTCVLDLRVDQVELARHESLLGEQTWSSHEDGEDRDKRGGRDDRGATLELDAQSGQSHDETADEDRRRRSDRADKGDDDCAGHTRSDQVGEIEGTHPLWPPAEEGGDDDSDGHEQNSECDADHQQK